MGQPAGITDERRMSDAEGLMWRLEADPTFASSFATVTLLDQPADLERLRRRMARAVVLVPRLRQRVLDRPLGLAPVWVDVAEVDIDHHVRNVTLPAPGTLRQLLDMATELLVQPFDRERPALGVPRRRRAGRRPGRGHPEDAPHHHRRRERHQAVAAVPRPRAPWRGAAAADRGGARRRDAPAGPDVGRRLAGSGRQRRAAQHRGGHADHRADARSGEAVGGRWRRCATACAAP